MGELARGAAGAVGGTGLGPRRDPGPAQAVVRVAVVVHDVQLRDPGGQDLTGEHRAHQGRVQ
uniref:Uncharacterized protein n=1 Tax=Arundo donax TaxID=35708 RepID=A0A0A9G0A4_ARUDO